MTAPEPDAATAARVGGGFALGGAVESVRRFGGGHINDTFLAVAGGSDYVVQRINRQVFTDPEQLMHNIVAVSQHIGAQLVPELVAARAGGWLVHDGDDAWRAWRRVAGTETITQPTPARAASAANLLGRFHARLADLEPNTVTETLPGFHGPARRLALLRAVVRDDPRDRVAGVQPEIAAALEAAPLAAVADDLVARVPRRVAHNDAKLDNVLFRGDDAVCLVDLDTVMPSAWFWDVGDLLRTASTRAAEDEPRSELAVVDPALSQAIIDGYRAGIATAGVGQPAEDEALEWAGPIVTYEQALRFLTDWIAGDVYYRTTRAGQNLDRARAQLALLASMTGTVGP
jgi:Ser/Thr protein kinase RdoA (MazF antagonist)